MRYDNHPTSGPYSELLAPPYAKIVDLVVNKGMIAKYQQSTYIFVPSSGQWCLIRSSEGGRHLCETIGIDKVPVNFLAAAEPFVALAEGIAQAAGNIIPSICVGTFRLSPLVEGTDMRYRQVTDILLRSNGFGEHMDRMSAFCHKTVTIRMCPRSMSLTKVSLAERILRRTMKQNDINVLKWCVGNALMDPVGPQRILYLYGLGGDGKTVAINTVLANLPGCSGPLTKDYMGKENLGVSDTDMQTLLRSRLVTFGDCMLQDGYKVNTEFIKRLTSGDVVSTATVSGRVQCAGIFGSNLIWHPSKPMMEKWFTRRMIAIHFAPITAMLEPAPSQYSEKDSAEFIHSCVTCRMLFDEAPITMRTALLTLFGSKARRFTRGIIDKPSATVFECAMATHLISSASRIEYEKLVGLICTFGRSLVTEENGVKALSGLTITVPEV
jgi:hypothetical protein